MTEIEGRELAAIPKWGEPRSEWSQDRPNSLTNTFGVVNKDQQRIKGLQADFAVFISPRLGQVRYVFSLKQYENGSTQRAYQQEVNRRKGLKPIDHAYSHEHYGEARFTADHEWSDLSFDDAILRFCDKTNLTLTDSMPHYEGFELK
jgi:hypothetical protein